MNHLQFTNNKSDVFQHDNVNILNDCKDSYLVRLLTTSSSFAFCRTSSTVYTCVQTKEMKIISPNSPASFYDRSNLRVDPKHCTLNFATIEGLTFYANPFSKICGQKRPSMWSKFYTIIFYVKLWLWINFRHRELQFELKRYMETARKSDPISSIFNNVQKLIFQISSNYFINAICRLNTEICRQISQRQSDRQV